MMNFTLFTTDTSNTAASNIVNTLIIHILKRPQRRFPHSQWQLYYTSPAPSGDPIFQLSLLQFRVDRFTLSESGTHALCGKRTVCKEQPREMLVWAKSQGCICYSDRKEKSIILLPFFAAAAPH